jgi:hypothetical protein
MKKSLLTLAVLFAGTLPNVAQAQFFTVIEERPRFHEFVLRQHHFSFRHHEDVRVGLVLPEVGVTFHEVPVEYHVRPGYGTRS